MARRLSRKHRPSLKQRLARLGAALALRAAAFAAAMAGVAGLAALLSYSVSDPSLNTATPRPAENWLGAPGAAAADLMLQGLGVVSALLLLLAVIWGALVAWRGARIERPILAAARWAAAPAALAACAAFAAALPVPAIWPFASGLGGAFGDALLASLTNAAQSVGAPAPLVVAAVFLIAAPGFLFVANFQWRYARQGWAAARELSLRIAEAAMDARDVVRRASRRRAEEAIDRGDQEEAPDADPAEVAPLRAERDEADVNSRRRAPRIVRSRKKQKSGKRELNEAQTALAFADKDYQLPPLHLLAKPAPSRASDINDDALEQNARMLESVLADFGVRGEIINVRPGPVVTLYELEPAAGVKSSRVIGLADDIARSMSAVAARVAVVPGRNVIGIELPNVNRETVFLRELLSSQVYEKATSDLTLTLGKSIGGEPVIADLARMPHLLIAGTTGSGKSVGINSMILSLLYRLSPDQCKMIMIDPKMLELSVYDGIPHLLAPVVTDPGKAVVALKWTVREMEGRYKKMSKLGVRNIAGFNQRLEEAEAKGEIPTRTVHTGYDPETGEPVYETEELDYEPMPFIVVVIDEMADLMMVAGKDIEAAVQRLAQMARAAGIHLIMATQRPSVDVITGTIKANFPTRISFQVTSKIDSRTILGEQGAEQLLGQGDMLYMASGGRLQRVHGPFVSDDEVEKIVKHLKKQGQPDYIQDVTEFDESDDGDGGGLYGGNTSSGDALYDQAIAIVARDRKASTSYIQRRLQIGYNRAATLIERMESDGLIGPANHAGKREVFLPEAAE